MTPEYANETVYLTFKTDRKTSALLKFIAKKTGKSQPELINEICQGFVESIIEAAESNISSITENEPAK